MSFFYGRDRYEAKDRVAKEILRRRKRGEPFEQVEVLVKRGIPASTFWGQAWGTNLEAYSDYESRLPRGRTYLRGGNVYDLTIEEGEIFAYVAGSEIYEVLIQIKELPGDRWKEIKDACAGEVGSLLDLLGGKLGPKVMEIMTKPDEGLFPAPKEIHLSCTCPDWADMCKHVAATLYAVGVQLDRSPDLLFKLRKIDHRELISQAVENAGAVSDLVEGSEDLSRGAFAANDLSELFGIEITEPETAFLESAASS